MAEEIIKKKISALPEEGLENGMHTIVVTPAGTSAKVSLNLIKTNDGYTRFITKLPPKIG